MYDIIGDIHGHADELTELLDRLGYTGQSGHYSHPERKVIFVGDFIDRGPKIRDVLQIVRPMIDNNAALAVMGNHEFNAIGYHTPHPGKPGEFVRPHSQRNRNQHEQTVKQVRSEELSDYIEWFRTLPMWLELDGVRVVHACWDETRIQVIERALNVHRGVSTAFLVEANTQGTPLFNAIDDVLKGKEWPLPDGQAFRDKDGHERSKVRVKWYEPPHGQTFASYALSSDSGFPEVELPGDAVAVARPYPEAAAPVFFGHYWLRADKPTRLARNVACLDYSVAKGGMLCAYQWDGERDVDDVKFVTIPAG